MNTTPPYRLARHDATWTILVDDVAGLDPVDAGTPDNPKPSETHTVAIRARDGVPQFLACEGRRITKRDRPGKASGARTYTSFGLDPDRVRDTNGMAPPQWIRDLYDAWRTGNLVDGRDAGEARL